jgi:hypothetical protein
MGVCRTRKRIRRWFAAFVALLFGQAAAAIVIVEPYPAFLYPPFARVKGETGTIDVLRPEFTVHFVDGTSLPATLEHTFDGVPFNLASAMVKEALLDWHDREAAVLAQMHSDFRKTLVRWRAQLRVHRPRIELEQADPELRGWLRNNLRRHFNGTPVRLTLRWWNIIYRGGSKPTEVRRQLLETASCEL